MSGEAGPAPAYGHAFCRISFSSEAAFVLRTISLDHRTFMPKLLLPLDTGPLGLYDSGLLMHSMLQLDLLESGTLRFDGLLVLFYGLTILSFWIRLVRLPFTEREGKWRCAAALLTYIAVAEFAFRIPEHLSYYTSDLAVSTVFVPGSVRLFTSTFLGPALDVGPTGLPRWMSLRCVLVTLALGAAHLWWKPLLKPGHGPRIQRGGNRYR